jgi:hypothetical protein
MKLNTGDDLLQINRNYYIITFTYVKQRKINKNKTLYWTTQCSSKIYFSLTQEYFI